MLYVYNAIAVVTLLGKSLWLLADREHLHNHLRMQLVTSEMTNHHHVCHLTNKCINECGLKVRNYKLLTTFTNKLNDCVSVQFNQGYIHFHQET